MKAMRYVPGVDIGTTGVKALLASEARDVNSSASVEYPLLTPRPNQAEQEPQTWWQAIVAATRNCLDKARATSSKEVEVAPVGLFGQIHSSVFLGTDGEVLRPAILWCDQRTEPQCREITDTLGTDI